jgi:hypothetical protein
MNVSLAIGFFVIALVSLVVGMMQGLGLAGIGDEPMLQGYLGGLSPLVLGAMFTFFLSQAISRIKKV